MPLKRHDEMNPADVPAFKPETSYPSPNIADRLVIERVPIAPSEYAPLPYHSPHPDYDTNGLILVWQGKVKAGNNQIAVVRVYSNDLGNDDWFNWSIKYSGDVVATPVYVRSYIELREDYVALAKASTLKTAMRLRVTAEGTGYTYGTPPTVTLSGGGASTQATARAIMNPAGTKVIGLELLTAGVGYTSNPSVGFSGGTGSGVTATAEIQPVGAVLVREETAKLDGEDSRMASLFIKVTRVYETLPGPWIPFTRYDDDLGPIQGRRRAVLNTGQLGGVISPTGKRNYEGRDGSAVVSWEIEENFSDGTGTPGNPQYPILVTDFYEAERGAVEQRSQIVAATGSEVGSLTVVAGVATLIRYEEYKDNPFLVKKITEVWAVPGPILRPPDHYDEWLGLIASTRQLVANTSQAQVESASGRTRYETSKWGNALLWKIIESWDTDEFPIHFKDLYEAERGAIQQTNQIVVATGSEVGSLVVVTGAVTLIRYEPYNEFLLHEIVETWTVPGPILRVADKYDEFLGRISGARQLFENTAQTPVESGAGWTRYESSKWGNALVWEVKAAWQPTDFPEVLSDTYTDERGAVDRTTRLVIPVGTEAAEFTRASGVVTKTWYEAYNEFILKRVIEHWVEVVIRDKRVTSEHGGAILAHNEDTDEPGAQTVETGYLVTDSKLVQKSPHEQTKITEKFDPLSAVPVLELLQGGTGYGPTAPTVGFSGGTCGTAPTASAVLGFPIASVTVNNGGTGFNVPPAVGIGGGGGPGGANAIAVLGFGVGSVAILAGGSYTVAPTVAFSGDGTGATGNVVMGYGVYFATVTDPGGRAKGTLTSDNTNVLNNDTVTIGTKVYTFKTALTPTEGEVLRGASADASLLNLIRAINHTGTPGTDYSVAAADPYVTAAPAVTANAFQVTAKQPGTIRNTLATTETSIHLSWGAATMTGGYNYAEVPRALFNGDGVGADADVIMGYPVDEITVAEADRGSGYTGPPEVVGNGGGSGLDAIALIGYMLDSITVDNPGTGFVSIPDVTIDPPDIGGIQAVAQAVMAFGVASALIGNGGSGYATPPAVSFAAGDGTGAAGTAVLGFAVDSATITNPGDSYTTFPSSSISGGGGTGAAINIRLGLDAASIVSAGSGYAVDQILDITGGTSSTVAQLRVTSVDGGGGITGVSIETVGVYSAIATNPRGVTGGGTNTPYTLTYASDGDTNDALYLLGTNFGAVAWANPHTAGRCVVTRSSTGAGTAAEIVDRTAQNTFTDNLPNSYIAIDLGAGNKIILNKYTLRNRSFADRAIRNWKIQGSNNAASNSVVDLDAATWVDIDSRVADTTMAVNADQFASYDGFSVPAQYRWIRVLQNGGNSGGDNYLTLAEIQLYGTLNHLVSGSGATFDLEYKVVEVNVTAGDSGYTSAPTIAIGTSIGTDATADAVLSATGSVKSVTITAPGTGYSANFALGFSGGGGTGAAGTAVLATSGGTVVSIEITEPGRGYTTIPAVAITGGGGSGALATAVLEASGELWRVDVVNGGVWETAPLLSFIGGGGAGAAATAVLDVSTMHVARLFVSASGRAYTTSPTISFSYEDGSVPVGLAATSTLNSAGEVMGVTMTAAGSAYTGATPVFSGGTGSGAAGMAILGTTGSVKSVQIQNGGLFKTVPAVSFIGGGGTGAVGTAVLASTGSVVELLLLTPGSCTVAPTVAFTGANTTLATALYHIGSDEWPATPGFDTDQTYGIVVNKIQQVVPTGRPHGGRAALCLGSYIDQGIIDRWKSVRKKYSVDVGTLPCPEIFPLRARLRIPPRLLSIEIVWTGNVSKLVAALASSSQVRVSSGANGAVIIRSSKGFNDEVTGYGIREWFFGPPPLAYALSFPIFNPRGSSGSVAVSSTNSSTGSTQAGPAVSFNDSFQSQVHEVDIRDHLVGFFNVISSEVVNGEIVQRSNQLAIGGSDVVVHHTSQPQSGVAVGPGGIVAIAAAGTPSTMKVSIPQSSPLTLLAGVPLLVDIIPERWKLDVWQITRVYVPTPAL